MAIADSCEMNAIRLLFLGIVGVIPHEGRLNSDSSSFGLCWIWQCIVSKESHSRIHSTIKFIPIKMFNKWEKRGSLLLSG